MMHVGSKCHTGEGDGPVLCFPHQPTIHLPHDLICKPNKKMLNDPFLLLAIGKEKKGIIKHLLGGVSGNMWTGQ